MPARQITLWRRLRPLLSEPLRRLATLIFVARVELQLVGPSPDWAPDTPALPLVSDLSPRPLPHAALWVTPPHDGKLVAVGPPNLTATHRHVFTRAFRPSCQKQSTSGLTVIPIHRQALFPIGPVDEMIIMLGSAVHAPRLPL